MTILVDARDILVTAGVGTFAAQSGWGIYISEEPIEPDTTITLFEAPGLPPNPKWLLDFPAMQIRVRGAKAGYVAARNKMEDIKNIFLGFDSQDINGNRWVSVTMLGDVTLIGYDDNKRPLLVANFRLIIEPAVPAVTNRTAL